MAKLTSLWLDTAEHSARPALAEDLRVDVCVVGAGISGLSAAFELSRQGARVAMRTGRCTRCPRDARIWAAS
jgi:ribulose 1,5-bisphosphate synthetase/thiazole synthase